MNSKPRSPRASEQFHYDLTLSDIGRGMEGDSVILLQTIATVLLIQRMSKKEERKKKVKPEGDDSDSHQINK